MRSGCCLLFLVALIAACGSGEEQPPELRAPEAFTWGGGQPISFALPPEGWERSRYQQGGREGVDFTKAGSVGETIFVAEIFFLGKRDRCGRLQKLLDDYDGLTHREFHVALQRARPYAEKPLNGGEARLAREANSSLDESREAYRRNDAALARRFIRTALERVARVHYTLDEVTERVIYTGEGHHRGVRVEVDTPASGEVAGVPSTYVDYALSYDGRDYKGREVYVIKNNRLFVLGFQGLEESFPLFERILSSVSFPSGSCEH